MWRGEGASEGSPHPSMIHAHPLTHPSTHARTHARTHTRAHTRTHKHDLAGVYDAFLTMECEREGDVKLEKVLG